MKYLSGVVIIFFQVSISFGQTFQSTLNQFASNYQPEKVYIHYDKSTYSAGDTIWFKAYILESLLPSTASKSLYIDWTDQQGKLINRTTAPVINGVTFGQIAIPEDLESSSIHVRAYTRWMLNFDSSFLYNKDIRLISKKPLPKKTVVASLTLFPEGGNLVAGLPNKVAFKANDQYGNPVKISGKILENNKEVIDIKSVHDGMGYFFITPTAGHKYIVRWTNPSGKTHQTDLPETETKGLNMQVASLPNQRTVLINASKDFAGKNMLIIGTMFNQPVFDISRQFSNEGSIQAVIPVQTLPSGILTITVLDENFHPQAERITFINNHEYKMPADMNVEHWGLNKRARNEIRIDVPDSIVSNMSISVTDLGIDHDTSSDIVSSLLLTSDLKGKIYNPAWYFKNDSDSSGSLLDLVMLTNGWRKISWESLASGKLPEIKYARDTAYETISGKIFGTSALQLQNMEDLVLIITEEGKNDIVPVAVNKDGSFNTGKLLFDTARVYYQMPKKAKGTVQFMQNKLPSVLSPVLAGNEFMNVDTSGYARHQMLVEELAYQLEKFKGQVLENVVIQGKKEDPKKEMDKKYTSGFFSGGSGTSFNLLEDPSARSARNIFEYLQGRIAGVTIIPSDPPQISWRMGTPVLFLNEFQVQPDALMNIPVADIAYVKALPPPFMGAVGGGAHGAIAVYTRKGGDQNYNSGGGLPSNTISGYSVIRQFYSPDYLANDNPNKDLRTTLYWNPEVITDPQHQSVLLTFYNNDITSAFRVVIEGITSDGRLIHVEKTME